ncbi:MAG: hypothetical protein EA376_12055 [Phycisphaeraceae bacterium]|nr:MAG: hypothetical protein EA376_12055 [Phycisphaeraceae bacterium]
MALAALIASASPLASQSASDAADDALAADYALESYLEDHALTELLIEQLTTRLRSVPRDGRTEIAERLASLYAQLLDEAEDPAQRAELERRSRDLLDEVPDAASIDLRLHLHRATFARAERLAERWRLRLVDAAQRDEALRVFTTLGPELASLGSRAHRHVEQLERQEQAVDAGELDLIQQRLDDARRQRSMAMYLAGWCAAYRSELTGASEVAVEGLRSFGWLLNASRGQMADIERARGQLMRFEHVARAAIGAGLCESVRGDTERAQSWLDMVENASETPDAVRREVPARRFIVLARAGEWNELAEIVRRRRAHESIAAVGGLPVSEARLLAVLTLEQGARSGQSQDVIRELAEAALTDLVKHGELAHVLDMATRYGTAPIGSEGFIVHHVRGLRSYEQARAAHKSSDGADPEKPTTSTEALQLYGQAIDAMRQAIASIDVDRFPNAHGNTAMLLGLSLYYSAPTEPDPTGAAAERLTQASDWLHQASLLLENPEQAADGLSLAIVVLDEAIALGGAGVTERGELRRERIAEFLTRFPRHERAGALLYRQGTDGALRAEESVAALLRVPEGTPAYDAARRQAARILYDMYRTAPRSERDWAALRYAEVAEPLLAADHRRAMEGDREAAARAAVRARRLLDALLGVLSPDASRIERALDAVLSIVNAGLVEDDSIRAELEYRRAQTLLVRGDVVGAERAIAELRSRIESGAIPDDDANRRFADAAGRLLFRHTVEQWRDGVRRGVSQGETEQLARRVIRSGVRVLHELEQVAAPDEQIRTVRASVAEAALRLYELTSDIDSRGLAMRHYRLLLEVDPNNRVFLRRAAELAEDVGDLEVALDCWRSLSAGFQTGSIDWFEARYRLISVLSRVDPARAREVLTQHIALHPDSGPAPWGDRIDALARRLNVGTGGDGAR